MSYESDDEYYERHYAALKAAAPLPDLGPDEYAKADAFIRETNAEARGWRMTPIDQLGPGIPPAISTLK
ncbi:hypothetical protein [Castellaniella sp.]|uniref:hypothetical protein n=1 Tax=Castellaniella sp. TaxID=1955812 RepID=UPI002AFDEA07|nr:hypothetical protein [Castellaniella sp.]